MSDQTTTPHQTLVPADMVLPQHVVVLGTKTVSVFPGMMVPVILTDEYQIEMVETATRQTHGVLGLFARKENTTKESAALRAEDLYDIGVSAKIIKKMNLPDGGINIIIQGGRRIKIREWLRQEPPLICSVDYLQETPLDTGLENEAMVRAVIATVREISEVNPLFTEEMKLAMVNSPSPSVMADLVSFALHLEKDDAQKILEEVDVRARLDKVLGHLRREKELSDLQQKIQKEVNTKISESQREFFLREELKAIKKELGLEQEDKDIDGEKFKKLLKEVKLSEEARKVAQEEVDKLALIPEASPEYALIRNYIDTLLALPWGVMTEDNLDLDHARDVLDEHHHGIEKVKERVLEFLAVRKLNPAFHSSIICLLGPPGVGKTSLGKAIAESLGRKFTRFSVGGLRDEAEIKGHRRTYIGAMPGKIIQNLKRCGSSNPVMMLDEVDKLASNMMGDPSSALLEVLDPEQNASFLDHYLDVPFDLSKVLFIATANSLDDMHPALVDRMEIIECTGYTTEEKVAIGRFHLVPKQLQKHGLSRKDITFNIQQLRHIATDYAREAGVRQMERLIGTICRKVAKQKVEKGKRFKGISVSAKHLAEYLGTAYFKDEPLLAKPQPGVAVGLAWTAFGGDVLTIEAIGIPIDGEKGGGGLKLTGKMGDVMLESANIAFSYVKTVVGHYGIDFSKLMKSEYHLHIPAGATPKDGPSAGITMACAMLSLFSHLKVEEKLAMTGELTLTGRVLPVGGIKEKLIAAHRNGIRTVLLPKPNVDDLKDVPENVKKSIRVIPIETFDEVIRYAFPSLKKRPRLAMRTTTKKFEQDEARA